MSSLTPKQKIDFFGFTAGVTVGVTVWPEMQRDIITVGH